MKARMKWSSGIAVGLATLAAAASSWAQTSALVTVSMVGPGTGTVTSTPAGISCPGTCSAMFPLASVVTLAAAGDPGFELGGWSGDCGGPVGCSLTMDGAKLALAAFKPTGNPYTVRRHLLPRGHDGRSPTYQEPVSDGTFLYGMTGGGGVLGYGVIWRSKLDGSEYTLLHEFTGSTTDGRSPNGSLVLAAGVLYGMTYEGGASSVGTIFKVNVDGTGFALLKSFAGGAGDGSNPYGSLIAVGGVLYGMTYSGGTHTYGTIFKVNPDGTGFALLKSFSGAAGEGRNPYGSLTEVGGVLFGMTLWGGASGNGTVFKVNSSGTGYATLKSFAGGAGDGRYPNGSLTVVGGVLYGMTREGGASSYGTIFRLNQDGTGYALLKSFAGGSGDGRNPYGSLTAVSGVLYGMTVQGGASNYGTIFKINPDGTSFALRKSFASGSGDGRNPYGSLTAVGGVLYGATSQGGASGVGTVFRINPDGTGFTLLHSHGTTGDGSTPYGALVEAGGVLYGMTQGGGASSYGTIFKVNPDGTGFALLRSFAGGSGDGRSPSGSLTAVGGVLYGMTQQGGANNYGTIFKVNPDGTGYALLKSFVSPASDGSSPYGSLIEVGGVLYGMTNGGGAGGAGTIFKINPDGTGFALVRSFAGYPADGGNPFGSLTAVGGVLYGMTYYGGAANYGAIFKINTDGTGFALLKSFAGGSGDGRGPYGSLTAVGGVLYGMTPYGGALDIGTVFKINADGTGYAMLKSFAGGGSDGRTPFGSLIEVGGGLYGMTYEGGTLNRGLIFRINPDGTGFTLLRTFVGSTIDGRYPQYGHLVELNGALFGMTSSGGAVEAGVVFSLRNAFTVAGTVTLGGVGLGGVTLSGLPGSPVTLGDGTYTATVPLAWSGTVTPVLASHTFTPSSRSYAGVSADQTAQDYSAVFVSHTLTVSKSGAGAGTVTSSPAGITCGATCSFAFADSTVVTLSAVADFGSTFTGWSGEGCSGTGTCVVTMNQARSVTATFVVPDTTPPTDPSVNSTSPATSTWSSDNTVQVDWSGATDTGGSGLAGYSVLFDQNATTQPDGTVDVAHGADPHSTTSAPLADGSGWYFHLSTCDNAGNCTSTVHAGPFWVDATAPSSPGSVTSTTHTPAIPSPRSTVEIAWGAASDATSQVDGYSVWFDADPAPACETMKDLEETEVAATSPVLANGTWYAHVCAVDVTGNWGAVVHGGPYVVDSTAADPDGWVYFNSFDGDTVERVRADGSGRTVIASGLGNPINVAASQALGKVYWVESSPQRIRRANLDGSSPEVILASGFVGLPYGIALDESGSKVYWTENNSGNAIRRANLDGSGVENLVTSGLSRPIGIRLDVPAGKVYWADYIAGTLKRANLDGTAVETVVSGRAYPNNVALDLAAGTVYWTEDYPSSTRLMRANLDGTGITTIVSAGSGVAFVGVDVDTDSGHIFLSEELGNAVRRLRYDSSQNVVLVANGARPLGLDFIPSPIPRTLTVSKTGTGAGTVTSSPAGIACGATCAFDFTHGTVVTLSALADSLSTFAGWSGAGCSGTGSCVVTMSQARSVTATFDQLTALVTVSVVGPGTGTVTSTPAGISCPGTCSALFPLASLVTLAASGNPGFELGGWSGHCSGPAGCSLTIDGAKLALAAFKPTGDPYTVRRHLLPSTGDGSNSRGSLTAMGGVLYGLTRYGGASNLGTIFRTNPDGSGFALLRSFAGGSGDGGTPVGALTAVGGVLYGMTYQGGASNSGTIFAINPDGSGFTLLRSFDDVAGDGYHPSGSLIEVGGVLYGMTPQGGTAGGGTVFKINPDGSGFALVRSFAGGSADGFSPLGSLTEVGGVLFGMTFSGGTGDLGTIFKINPDGSGFALLRSFAGGSGDGSYAYGSLTAAGGELFGMTFFGGTSDMGTIFRISPDGSGFVLLKSFAGGAGDGITPNGSLTAVGGVLYGATSEGGASNLGTIFKINPDATGFALLRSFSGSPTDGRYPVYPHLTELNGSLHGMTYEGGYAGAGVIFSRCIEGTFYRDADGDGFGDPADTVAVTGCSVPSGYVADNTDCDDTDNTVYPGAPELCDGKDNDCDGQADEPAFAGLASATPLGGGECGIRLDWSAVSACSGNAVFSVYRSTSSGFTPGPGTLLAACVAQGFLVDTAVAAGTPYFYVVRAENPSTGGAGPCYGGGQDSNLVQRTATASACTAAAGDVVYLTARAGNASVRLEWLNPSSGYASTRACIKASGYPSGPTDAGATCTDHAGSAGAYGTTTVASLPNGTEQYFAAYVWSGSQWSGGRFTQARPFDTSAAGKWAYSSAATTLAPSGVRPNVASYAVSNDRILHAMTAGTAGGVWPAGWTPASMNAPAQARPSMATFPTLSIGGTSSVAFAGAQDGRVYAFSSLTGALLWASPVLGDAVQAGPSIVSTDFGGSANLALVATRTPGGDSKVYGLNLADGTVAWTFDNGGGAAGMGIVSSQLSAEPSTSRLWVTSRAKPGGSADSVWCLSFTGSSATKLWSRALGDADAAATLRNGRLYVGTNAGTVHALDPATGSDLWGAPYATADGAVKSFVWVQTTGALTRLYLSTNTKVHALDDGGGSAAALWPAYATGSPSPVLVISGNLYVGTSSGNGRILRLDALTGSLLGSVTLGDPALAKTVGAPSFDTRTGQVLVGTDEGAVYAVSAPF